MLDIILVNHKERDLSKEKQISINTPEQHRIIQTCQIGKSASINRNYGLSKVESEIFIMMDSDITGFYKGWLTDLITPMIEDKSIIITSIRCLDKDKKFGPMMGGHSGIKDDNKIYDVSLSKYKNYKRVLTACLAIRKNDLTFDEEFIGSGYEDTAYMNYINIYYPDSRIVINNKCRLIHLNYEQNQGGKWFENNKKHYISLFPDDEEVINQKDWTIRKGD